MMPEQIKVLVVDDEPLARANLMVLPVRLSDVMGVSQGSVVAMVTIMALGGFALAQKIERSRV